MGMRGITWFSSVFRYSDAEREIGGSRPGTEMVGGDFLSRPRPYMGCSAWVDGWMDGWMNGWISV